MDKIDTEQDTTLTLRLNDHYCGNRCSSAIKSMREAIFFKLSTKQHQEAWNDYLRILSIRCNVAMVI